MKKTSQVLELAINLKVVVILPNQAAGRNRDVRMLTPVFWDSCGTDLTSCFRSLLFGLLFDGCLVISEISSNLQFGVQL